MSRNVKSMSRRAKSKRGPQGTIRALLQLVETRHEPRPLLHPLCDRLRAAGRWNPNWDPFYDLDPAWTEAFMAMGTKPMLAGVLDPKVIEFLAIAVDASCTHLYAPACAAASARRWPSAQQKEEIAAVLRLTSVLGIHTMSLAAPILLEELACPSRRPMNTTRSPPAPARQKPPARD